MNTRLSSLDRRSFLRGIGGFALALPAFETFTGVAHAAGKKPIERKRLACFYIPNGVPMPRRDDPAYKDWSWFPHGEGKDFTFTKCLDPLESLRGDLTVLSGLSHPFARKVHGHSNADQFLTGAAIGGRGIYKNSISLDQRFAAHVGDQTRHSSLVLSTDGGVGSPRGAHTISFTPNGRAIPAEHKPKRIFDQLFVKSNGNAERRLALSKSALDELMADARSLKRDLSQHDQNTLDEFLDSVRSTEVKIEKASHWMNMPLPTVDVDHLNLDITPDQPREYVRTMFELIFLAFETDSTRSASYMIGKELGAGISDYLARAVGFPLTHKLSHLVKNPGGWENFGIYCRFLTEELSIFINRLKSTLEPAGEGTMLDNTMVLYGSATSSFHNSRNYPLILAGGQNMGLKHGRFLNLAEGGGENYVGAGSYADKNIKKDPPKELPLSNLYLTMLHQLGVETESFGGSDQTLSQVLT